MVKDFKEVLKNRRTYYAISNGSPIPDREIEEIVEFALSYVPSAFNSQSSRLVLLLGKEHKKLWEIVKNTLQKIVPASSFEQTKHKIDTSFASGYGTVLFFEDESVTHSLQKKFPLYAEKFPTWSQHTSAMHQLVVWAMLEDIGFGASLQHYNPLIDDEVKKTWELPSNWVLIAQMPFGIPMVQPEEKSRIPIEERIKIFK